MEPLDLESRPPRGPRETLLGCVFLPRTLDKVRAQLPGGRIGAYVVEGPNSLSAYLLHKLKIAPAELRDVVARAGNEEEVVAWLRERIDPAVVVEVNAKLTAARVDNLGPELRRFVEERNPILREHPEIVWTFDMLEADDAATFATKR